MYTLLMLTRASFKMYLRNGQAVFFTILFPFIFLFIFGNMNFDGPLRLHLGLATHQPSATTEQILKQIRSVKVLDIDEGPLEKQLERLKNNDLSAVIEIPDDLIATDSSGPKALKLYANNAAPGQAQSIQMILEQFVDKASMAAIGAKPLVTIERADVSVHVTRYVEFLLPGIIAMAIMQMSVFSVSHVFAQYKEKGILKRLLATPMRPFHFVAANIITRLVVALIQAAIFISVGAWMFNIHMAGSYALLGCCVVLGALMFLGLGFAISGLARTSEAVPVLGNIIVMPMMFLGNLFFSASNMPAWLASVAKYLPVTYFVDSMRGIMQHGSGPRAIQTELIGMTIWAALLIALATVTFRFQERSPE